MEAHSQSAEPSERDTTDEWRVAPARTLTSVAELEGRIDVALATARTAEEAALEIGAASLEAAEQARRAAALAERASIAAARAAESAREASLRSLRAEPAAPAEGPPSAQPRGEEVDPSPSMPASNGVAPRRADPFEDRISAFRLRAEKVIVRLQKIEAGAVPGSGPSEVVRLR
jgi:hypothetical protein